MKPTPIFPARAVSLAIAIFTWTSNVAQLTGTHVVLKFKNGRTLMREEGIFRVVNEEGKPVFDIQWNELGRYNDKYYIIRKSYYDSSYYREKNTWSRFERFKLGWINRETGDIPLPPTYDRIDELIDGKALVRTNRNQFGFIREDGSVLIPPVYSNIKILANGNCVLANNDTAHFYKRDLSLITSVTGLSSMRPANQSCLFIIIKDSAAGFIDCNGSYNTNKEWREIDKVENNMAFILGEKGFGVYHIGKKKLLFEPKYRQYEYNSEYNVLLLKNDDNSWIIADSTGKSKPGWRGDNILRYTKGYYFYRNDGLWGLVQPTSGKIIRPTWQRFESVPGQNYFKGMLPGETSWKHFDLNGKEIDPATFRFQQ